ncbi:GyrI-like domain-containing protein [Paenibacillus harenae]|uniref:Transcriptional regulator YdeE n=1 Tax=Paenibacillus harenae TaxID=306543 RepID=A0ABT9UB83_PAEHA|nr:GyrI-like domain-containing protein [Paenibacillus harenae]MDQ0059831.1 putative transcriptional regulator YdeE [Paenibacillus harenae]MDQ0116273.1 putative transcriptional regulator YdeE [Paenibacillus harenae]
MNGSQVELVKLDAQYFVGLSITSSFEGHDSNRVETLKQQFMARRFEIKHAVNPVQYVCPHFNSETLFTYFYCLEVSTLEHIPEGMIGFSIPAHTYAKVRTELDPYEVLHRYLNEQGLQNDSKALALEIYNMESPRWPDQVNVYIPIKD